MAVIAIKYVLAGVVFLVGVMDADAVEDQFTAFKVASREDLQSSAEAAGLTKDQFGRGMAQSKSTVTDASGRVYTWDELTFPADFPLTFHVLRDFTKASIYHAQTAYGKQKLSVIQVQLQECYACVVTKGNIYGFQARQGCFNDTRHMKFDKATYCGQDSAAVARNGLPQELASQIHAKSCCYTVTKMLGSPAATGVTKVHGHRNHEAEKNQRGAIASAVGVGVSSALSHLSAFAAAAKAPDVTKLDGEMITEAEIFQPRAESPLSNTGSSASSAPSPATLVIVAVALTSLLCCMVSCCMAKALCGCLFGGVEDVFDGDGKVALTGQAEEMGMAGMAGHYLA